MTCPRLLLGVAALLAGASCSSDADPKPDADVGAKIELVGSNALMARGMNSALAIIGDHVYVGSRTDGTFHDNAGILIVDVSDPTNPQVVGEIGKPEQALIGMSSRELRAVPDKNLLIVLNFACSVEIHACRTRMSSFPETGGAEEADNIKFYDVSNPTAPELVATYNFGSSPRDPFVSPHEFYLWRDPADANRVLLYFSTPIGPPAMQVLDISDIQNISVLATFDPEDDAGLEESRSGDALLHSVSVTDDGTVGFISCESAGLLIADTSEIANGTADPTIRLLTPVENRIDYSPPAPPGTHSAVDIPGRNLVVVTDEVYPAPVFPGCPWGWMRIVDYTDSANPFVASEYKLAQNDPSFCTDAEGGPTHVNYTAHNATNTPNLSLISWHAGGLQVIDTTDPADPVQLAVFIPETIPAVATDDPVMVGHRVTMWSYPIIKDGLIYVTDIRNGLFILRYTGPYAEQIDAAAFVEGNSNIR